MATYLLTYPNGSQVTAKGVSIATQGVSVQIPPSVPANFIIHIGREPVFRDLTLGAVYSLTVPVISDAGGGFMSGGRYWWYPNIQYTNAQGVTQNFRPAWNALYWYTTPGYTTVSRCNVLVTDTSGSVLTIPGQDNVACPTWVTTPDDDCSPTEIKCNDPSDPRGFCCVSCDSLNSKIRALI